MEMEDVAQASERPSSKSPRSPARGRRNPDAVALRAVERRLAEAERTLSVQFMRIAQLQAELDRLLARVRRSPDVLVTR
jgi:uncharacterized sporulation protein YeaH/YhbH (DUF444 family)